MKVPTLSALAQMRPHKVPPLVRLAALLAEVVPLVVAVRSWRPWPVGSVVRNRQHLDLATRRTP